MPLPRVLHRLFPHLRPTVYDKKIYVSITSLFFALTHQLCLPRLLWPSSSFKQINLIPPLFFLRSPSPLTSSPLIRISAPVSGSFMRITLLRQRTAGTAMLPSPLSVVNKSVTFTVSLYFFYAQSFKSQILQRYAFLPPVCLVEDRIDIDDGIDHRSIHTHGLSYG